jgi:hypothetical protein
VDKDRTWLAKVTNALNQHWQMKNAARKNGSVPGSENGAVRSGARGGFQQ